MKVKMRKKSSILNLIGSLGANFTVMLFNFITQTVLIKMLGVEYSGINGLFTNILTMLSIAELGIGSTIIYKLYKPIAEDDKETIKAWMKFYKICYRCIAIVVGIIGVLLIPFIPTIVGEVNIKESIIILYMISLLDTILSYIMTYKRSLLYADQKNYIINFVHMGYTVFMSLTQIIILIFIKQYIYFIVIKLVFRVLENVILNAIVNKKYPYILEKSKNIDKSESKDLVERVKAILLQKISFVINKGIDNITISIVLGVTAVGYYTNYNLIVLAVCNIIYQMVSSMTASVGNLLTENDTNKNYDIYKKLNMFNSFFTAIAMTGFTCAATPFIKMWVGNQFILSNLVLFSFTYYIYADSIRRSITIYKEAAGICKEDQFMYVIMTIINLGFSILLCKLIGTAGVILGTAISYTFLIVYSYPKYIYKPIFKREQKEYYKENGKYLLFMLISIVLASIICSLITTNSALIQFMINGIVSVVITTILFIIIFGKTNEFKYYISLIKKFKGRLKNNEINKNAVQ